MTKTTKTNTSKTDTPKTAKRKTTKRYTRPVKREFNYQCALVAKIREFNQFLATKNVPRIWFNGCQNGVPLPKAALYTRVNMVRTGAERGHPDIMIYARSTTKDQDGKLRDFVGLALELKSESGHMRPEQREFMAGLYDEGWLTLESHTEYDAVRSVFEYMRGVPRCGMLVKEFLAPYVETCSNKQP